MNHIDIFSFWLHINQFIILLRISSTRVFMMIIFLSAQTSSSMSWIKNISIYQHDLQTRTEWLKGI